MSIPRLVFLHLGPGALATAVFVLLAPVLRDAGHPSGLAVLRGGAHPHRPWELGLVLWAGRRSGRGRMVAVGFREPLARRDWLRLFPATLAASLIAFLALSSIEPAILEALFDWLPS